MGTLDGTEPQNEAELGLNEKQQLLLNKTLELIINSDESIATINVLKQYQGGQSALTFRLEFVFTNRDSEIRVMKIANPASILAQVHNRAIETEFNTLRMLNHYNKKPGEPSLIPTLYTEHSGVIEFEVEVETPQEEIVLERTDVHFIVMEELGGGVLKEYLAKLDLKQRILMFKRLLRTVHESVLTYGYIPLDMNTGNALIEEPGIEANPNTDPIGLIDFGSMYHPKDQSLNGLVHRFLGPSLMHFSTHFWRSSMFIYYRTMMIGELIQSYLNVDLANDFMASMYLPTVITRATEQGSTIDRLTFDPKKENLGDIIKLALQNIAMSEADAKRAAEELINKFQKNKNAYTEIEFHEKSSNYGDTRLSLTPTSSGDLTLQINTLPFSVIVDEITDAEAMLVSILEAKFIESKLPFKNPSAAAKLILNMIGKYDDLLELEKQGQRLKPSHMTNSLLKLVSELEEMLQS